MIASDPVSLGFLHRPATGALVAAIVCSAIGWALHVHARRLTRVDTPAAGSDRRPAPLAAGGTESPAVVALLTNRGEVPRSAVTATALDLAARGWIRLAAIDGELVVIIRSRPAAGDTLRGYEHQVLNHLAARAFNDVTSAGTLARSHHRLRRTWWLRFDRDVAAEARQLGLTFRRYDAQQLVPAALAAAIGTVLAWRSARTGERIAIADSWGPRLLWLVVTASLVALAWHTLWRGLGSAQRLTEVGHERGTAWMGYRRRLRDRIPIDAGVLAAPAQQEALARAAVMGVADQVLHQLPVAPADHRAAWSEAGGVPHVVTVRYPVRPGYGQHPAKVLVAGAIALLVARWARGFLSRVADGDGIAYVRERVPGRIGLVEGLAEVLAAACWIPIVWGVWAVIAGAVDSLVARERIGAVVRARPPGEVLPGVVARFVRPFAERDRFSTYLAVDDGRRTSVAAWLASERTAAPQGAQARVRATPLLGYVKSSEPVGTGTRIDA